MKPYSDELLQVNIPIARTTWSLARRLAMVREKNPNAGSGAGARRRSSYEHQLDNALLLLAACEVQGATVRIPGRQTISPFELLHAPAPTSARPLAVYRRKVNQAIRWCHDNDLHRLGWADAQSQRRAARQDGATRFYLGYRAWTPFLTFRRVVRYIARLLHTMHVWWPLLLPALRSAATSPKGEELPSGARAAILRPERGAGSSPIHVGALVERALPPRTM